MPDQVRHDGNRLFTNPSMLIHPKNMGLTVNKNLEILIYALSNYYILLCLLVRRLKNKTKDIYISNRSLKEIYFSCGFAEKFDLFGISRLWIELLADIIEIEMDRFEASVQNAKKIATSKILSPPMKMYFHRILPDNRYGFVEAIDDVNAPVTYGNYAGVALNLSQALGYKNEIWYIINYDTSKGNGYLFLPTDGETTDTLPALVLELFSSARLSSIAVQSIGDSWEDFLQNPKDKVMNDLNDFEKWIGSFMFESYQTRDEFLKFKSFSRMIGDIDTELDVGIYKIGKIQETYKKGKKFHIPLELRSKLLEANEELSKFVNSRF